MSMQVQVNWTQELQFVARAGNGPGVIMDVPDGGSGPSPMEMVLMGIAGCTAVDVVMIMKKKRTQLEHFTVNITGDRADQEPKRFTRLTIEYVLTGKGIKNSAVEQAIRLSEEKYCSALASVNAEVEHSYRIIESDKA